MQPDEERYEPSIFNVTIPYSVPSDQNSRRAAEHRCLEEEEERQARLEHNRLAESNARQGARDAAAFREGLSIRTSEDTPRDASPERHRQAADSDSASLMSDLPLTPDSEPDVPLHWINDLPTNLADADDHSIFPSGTDNHTPSLQVTDLYTWNVSVDFVVR